MGSDSLHVPLIALSGKVVQSPLTHLKTGTHTQVPVRDLVLIFGEQINDLSP